MALINSNPHNQFKEYIKIIQKNVIANANIKTSKKFKK